MPRPRTLVLDAMGVLYRAADDVGELLVPFVGALGGASAERVQATYLRASCGECSASDFWREVGLHEGHEDAYLSRHEIAPDLPSFLEWARAERYALACLSNDVERWSRKLRRRFGLEESIADWVISSEVKARKPDPRIYEALLRRLGLGPSSLLLVDDREKNLDAASRAGLRTALLRPVPPHQGTQGGAACGRSLRLETAQSRHEQFGSLSDLAQWLGRG